MDVLTSETCRELYKEIIKQVTSSSSLFTELPCLVEHSTSIQDGTSELILSSGSTPPQSPSKELWVQGWVGPRRGLGMVVRQNISSSQEAKPCTRLLTSALCYTLFYQYFHKYQYPVMAFSGRNG